MKYTLFDKEELVIRRAEQQSDDFTLKAAAVSDSLRELIEAYRSSLREQQRLIRVSDLQQENMRHTAEDLNNKTIELEKQAVHLQHLNCLLEQEIENRKRVEAELQRMVSTDMLTGAGSRSRFWEVGKYEMQRRARSQTPLAVLMLDIDRFKSINDRFGHAVGDRALRFFAGACMNSIRTGDSFGRLGGEEFAILLPDTAAEEALKIAERLRVAVADGVMTGDFGRLQFTTSVGVAVAIGDEQFDQLLRRADKALYEAKSTGRNRTVFNDRTTD